MRCESCGTEFLIEKDHSEINQTINNYYSDQSSSKILPKKKQPSPKRAFLAFFFLLLLVGGALYLQGSFDQTRGALHSTQHPGRKKPESPAMLSFLYQAYGKPADQLTAQELGQLTYLDVRKTEQSSNRKDYWTFAYSREPYVVGEEPPTQTIYVPIDQQLQQLDFTALTGLQYLELNNTYEVSSDEATYSLSGLTNLAYYGADFNQSFREIAEALPQKNQLKGLTVQIRTQQDMDLLRELSALESLHLILIGEEITDFSPLQQLSALSELKISTKVSDLSWLSGLTNLKKLTLDSTFGVKDYASLYSLSGLESLSIENSETLKELDFIRNMPHLKELILRDTAVQSLAPLTDRTSLLHLSLVDNSAIKDYGVLPTLSSLQNLTLDVDTDVQALPPLSGLQQLTTLRLESRYRESIIGNPAITELILTGDIDGPILYAGSPPVETLYLLNADLDDSQYLSELQGIRSLTLDDVSLYGSESSYLIFAIVGLEHLSILNSSFGLAVEAIPPNTTLKTLDLTNVSFYQEDGLTALLPKIATFTSLEELSLPNQQIKDLTFVQGLSGLKRLNLQDNYVNDVSVLTTLPILEWVNLENNPVTNRDLLNKVIVVN